MAKLKNTMEIFKLLEKSNCRKCNETTCLAFAGSVFLGKKQLNECPHLDQEIIDQFDGGHVERPKTPEQDMDEVVADLKKQICTTDLSSAAKRVGAGFFKDKLTIKILGKDFHVDTEGNLSSDIHMHPWVIIPILNYIMEGSGTPVSGEWVPLRELKNGKSWEAFFEQRCEKPLKKIADTYTDFFEDMIHLFNGKQVKNHYHSDISLVLHPLPKIPMLICYWKPEDGLESDFHLFFDATAEDYLSIESLYGLGAGLVMMFEKISLRHGV